MLILHDVSFQYGDTPILQNLSCRLSHGVTTALTGASGSGKTTLLYLMAGLLSPGSGTLQNTYAKTAVAFQEPRLFPWMTALENVSVVCKNKDMAEWYLRSLFSEDDIVNKYPDELSGGMKMRISLARALAFEPDLLLLDEPFRGLDAQTKQKTVEFVFEQMEKKTCVLITHAQEELCLCADQLHLSGVPATVKHGSVEIE